MKNFKIFFTILFFAVSFVGHAQKVKMKKGIVTIDEVATYKFEEEGSITTFSSNSGVEFLSVNTTDYDATHSSKFGRSYTYKVYVYTLRFLESGKELTTDLDLKAISKALYKSNMVDENGKIDEEKLNIFINKYNNENLKYKIN
ncbi:hypothetical protein D3C87_171370 [compost metagenome]